MTKINQDFELYYGDDEKPVFTIYDAAGAPLNIATVAEIEWNLYDNTKTIRATKKKTTGEIAFVTTGADGQIYVTLVPTDTTTPLPALSAPLAGWYWHSAKITDALSKITTVEVGRLLVKKREKGE